MGRLRSREGEGLLQVIQSIRAENRRLDINWGVGILGPRKEPWPPCLQLPYLSFLALHPPTPSAGPCKPLVRNNASANLTLSSSAPLGVSLTLKPLGKDPPLLGATFLHPPKEGAVLIHWGGSVQALTSEVPSPLEVVTAVEGLTSTPTKLV